MLLAALASLAVAASPDAQTEPSHPLRIDWVVDGAVTGASAVAWFTSEVFLKKQLAPATCHWCDRAPDGTDRLNALDAWGEGIRWSPSAQPTADLLSSLLAFAVLPATMIGLDLISARATGDVWSARVDLLIIAESVMLATLVTQAVKFPVGRARPYVHDLPPGQGPAPGDDDANLSFFSGHSSFVFSLVVATGTVARLRGYRWAWLVWAVGLPLAVAVPVLRIGADKHYLTDVLTGSAVGALFGYGVPTLFHGRLDVGPVELTAAPAPGGLGIQGRF